ncbi:MarR family winged helix-turn-helix transcriptional regulator [Aestuariivirga sp.]|uniref:MarR family winged helix-turn-helix transcriptional regulator n=1 Tax=Aestuariivirga sp. TaxID=2650926 RepID=UPI003BAA94A6
MSSDEEDNAHGHMIVWPLERLGRVMRAREHEGGLNPAQWEALRFLARANRFSDSPSALTRYLGATKGTISQTLMALERKGYIAKAARAGGRKSLRLSLTEKGREALSRDPWADIARSIDALGGKTRRRLHRGLDEVLDAELKRADLASFGVCTTCRFFREKGSTGQTPGPHFCMLFEDGLTEQDSVLICIAHAAAH